MALDAEQILKKVFLPATQSLDAKCMGAATAPKPDNNLSAKQILKRVYDSATGKIRCVNV